MLMILLSQLAPSKRRPGIRKQAADHLINAVFGSRYSSAGSGPAHSAPLFPRMRPAETNAQPYQRLTPHPLRSSRLLLNPEGEWSESDSSPAACVCRRWKRESRHQRPPQKKGFWKCSTALSTGTDATGNLSMRPIRCAMVSKVIAVSPVGPKYLP